MRLSLKINIVDAFNVQGDESSSRSSVLQRGFSSQSFDKKSPLDSPIKEKIISGIEMEIKKSSNSLKNKSIFQRVTPLISEITKRKVTDVASVALLTSVRQEFQKKLLEKYQKKLNQKIVSLSEPEDSELVSKILQKHKPSKREMSFVVQALMTLPIFDQNQNILTDLIHNMSVFKEFRIEQFNALSSIFNKGYKIIQIVNNLTFQTSDIGKKFYILLKDLFIFQLGEVFCLIGDQRAEGNLTPASQARFDKSPPSFDSFSVAFNQKNLNELNKQILNIQSSSPTSSPQTISKDQKDSVNYNEYIYLKSKYPLQKVTKIYKPGEYFGEIALLTRGQRMGTMVCRTDVDVISLTREGFNRIKSTWQESELNKKLNFLRKFSFYQGMSDSRLMSTLHMTEIHKYEKKHILYAQDDKSKYLYFILEGVVQLFTYVEDEYPLVYNHKLSKQTLNSDISKYLKNQKPKLRNVPLIKLGHGSYFGEWEIINSSNQRQTKAIIESESAEIFQIEIAKFLEVMKGYNGEYNYMKDFYLKNDFQKERIEKIIDVNSQVYQNILNTKRQQQFENLKRQIKGSNETKTQENDSDIQDDIDLNNTQLENSRHNINQDEQKDAINFSKLNNSDNQYLFQSRSHSTSFKNTNRVKKNNYDTEYTNCNTVPVSPESQMARDQIQRKKAIKKTIQTENNEEVTNNMQIDYIDEDQIKVSNTQIRRKVNSFSYQVTEVPTIRNKTNSEINYIDEFFRTKGQSTTIENKYIPKNSSNVCSTINVTNAHFYNEQEDTLLNYTNRDKFDSSSISFHKKSPQVLNGIHDNYQFQDVMSLPSRKNSQGSDITSKQQSTFYQTSKKPDFSQTSRSTSKIDKEYFHSFLKQKLELIQHEKEQNLSILNYKDINLKFIGISPQEVIEECRRQQRFGMDKGEMTNQMKKTVLQYTSSGLFTSPQSEIVPILQRKGSQSTHDKQKPWREMYNLNQNQNSLSLCQTLFSDKKSEFKNKKLLQLFKKEEKTIDKKNEYTQNSQNNEKTIEQTNICLQTEENNIDSKMQLNTELNEQTSIENKNEKQYNEKKEQSLTRQQREQQEIEVRKIEQMQKYKNKYSLDGGQDLNDFKIKSPRIFPMKDRLQREYHKHPQKPDLFQIKKFSFQSKLQEGDTQFKKDGNDEEDQLKIKDLEQLYFPKILSTSIHQQSENKPKNQKKNASQEYVAIAAVHPYFTQNMGSPKNQYTEIKEFQKEENKLKNYLLSDRKYKMEQPQLNNMPQNKEQKEIIQHLMQSPRIQIKEQKPYDSFKNTHINRQKLNNQRRNKSLI